MQVGARQGEDARLQFGHLVQAVAQQRQLFVVQLQGQHRAFFEHPVEAAVAAAFQNLLAGRQVQARQPGADFRAVVGVGLADVLAGQARLQQRRLAGQFAQGLAALRRHRIGHRQAGLVQALQQFDEERHVGARTALHQGEDELAAFQADEEVAVLAAGGNALEVLQAAEPVGFEEDFQLRAFEGCEDGHGLTS